jgi:hypothetical protein
MSSLKSIAEATSQITYTSVAPGQFVKVGTEPGSLAGSYGRMALLATLPAAPGRTAHRVPLHPEDQVGQV